MTVTAPVNRNTPCPCGSGKRYKHCHGAITAETATTNDGDVRALMNAALAQQTAGALEAAAQLYDQALALDPRQPDALHMRAVVALSMQQFDAALVWIDHALAEGLNTAAIAHNRSLIVQAMEDAKLERANRVHYVEVVEAAAALSHDAGDEHIAEDEVRILAYYLPQFHRVDENDAWWGLGFTEWTNVRNAVSNFAGHWHPRVPGALGYYDLFDPSVRVRQAALAHAHGISGFCYYHYWFKGRRMLQRPGEAMLASGEPDFPFCVFWANENWIRSWDGGNRKVLLAQEHSAQDDRDFIMSLLPLFADSRYIRVHGQPLLMVYRSEYLPEPGRTFDLWRTLCLAAGEMPPYIVTSQTGEGLSPLVSGADATAGFPPHCVEQIARVAPPQDIRDGWHGAIYDLRLAAAAQAMRAEPEHTHFSTVTPMWDNTARRQHDGTTFINARPDVFRASLREALLRTREQLPPGQRLLFVNAWNEWAESAYLEPDEQHGMAFLEAARDARYIPKSLRRFRDHMAALRRETG